METLGRWLIQTKHRISEGVHNLKRMVFNPLFFSRLMPNYVIVSNINDIVAKLPKIAPKETTP